MLRMKLTEHYAGVRISASPEELNILVDAIHELLIPELSESLHYFTVSNRILGVCYDLRHAAMGDREVETSLKELPFSVESGVGRRDMETVCSCYVLFPEICFVMMGLNVTIDYRIRKLAKRSGNEAGDVHVIWNETILELRKFQSVFLNCMREQLSQKTFTRFRNYIFKGADFADRMYGQYLDIRNRKFMGKSPDKRKKDLAIEAKRLMEYPHEVNYQDMKREIDAFAEEQQIDHSDVRFADNDYPDIIW